MNKKEKLAGRPTKYKPEVHNNLVYMLVRDNKTNDEIADFMDISKATLQNWLNEHPIFLDCYKRGLEAKIDHVARNMYTRACGQDVREVRTIYRVDENGKETGEKEVIETIKQLPPDVGAGAFILKTQRRQQWGERIELVNEKAQEKQGNILSAIKTAINNK